MYRTFYLAFVNNHPTLFFIFPCDSCIVGLEYWLFHKITTQFWFKKSSHPTLHISPLTAVSY